MEDFPTYDDEEKGNNVFNHRVDLVPHVEEGRAHAPIRGILASFQEGPQDLIHGGPSTISEQHDCAILQLEEGGGEREQHHVMRGTHPSQFQKVKEKRRKNILCRESKGKVSQPYV